MKNKSPLFIILSLIMLVFSVPGFTQGTGAGQTNYPKSAQPQKKGISITPMYGYVFNETFYTYDYEVELEDATPFGGILSFELRKDFDVEISYFHQQTTADIRGYYFFSDRTKTNVDYIFIGGCHNVLLPNPAITPFAGLDLGAAIASPDGYSSVARFSFGLKAGLKAMFTDHIGIRAQTQLWVPVQGVGIVFSAGSGGASTGVAASSSITQFGFEGGIILKL